MLIEAIDDAVNGDGAFNGDGDGDVDVDVARTRKNSYVPCLLLLPHSRFLRLPLTLNHSYRQCIRHVYVYVLSCGCYSMVYGSKYSILFVGNIIVVSPASNVTTTK